MFKTVKPISRIPEAAHSLLPVSEALEGMLKSSVQTVKSGHFLIMEGEDANSVFCLLSGWLALSKCLPEGERQIIDLAFPGEIIEVGGASGAVSTVSIEALTDVRMASVSVSYWQGMKQQRPELDCISTNIQAATRARMSARMLRLGRGDAATRMAYALLELNLRLGAVGLSAKRKFQIPMSQRVLGDFVGLSAVHVCRTLGQFVRNKMIVLGGHMTVEILDIDGLAEIAGVDLQLLPHELLAQTDHSPSPQCRPTSA